MLRLSLPFCCSSTERTPGMNQLEQTLRRYVGLYNHHLPQAALNVKPPIHAMKQWHAKHPELFHRKPYNRPGLDK
jgi:hypothetical protein